MGISSLFNIGSSGINASQSQINVTGNNIVNAYTPGYARQYVSLEDAFSLNTNPGATGLGVDAVEVLRRFDTFMERTYVGQISTSSRWEEQYKALTSIESIFNESNTQGISSALTDFFQNWEDLSLRPDDDATRQDLLTKADSLTLLLQNASSSLDEATKQMNSSIEEDVIQANDLIQNIADLNHQIDMNSLDGVSNPNDLYDKRDYAVRQLAEIIDIDINDNGKGDYTVRTKTGQSLVEGSLTYSLEFNGPMAENNLIPESNYAGTVNFEGEDAREYTIEIIQGGNAGTTDDPNNPTFRVSLDNGKTWLRNEDGTEQHFTISDDDGDGTTDSLLVNNLNISFTEGTGFTTGDKFNITPKDGLYWIEPTRGAYNITPQTYFDGTENPDRTTGGSLAAFFTVRDENIGRYQDELNAVADTLAWEVNRLHSQGSGLNPVAYQIGTEDVYDTSIALGLPQSGLHYYDKLEKGNMQIHLYNQETGDYVNGGALDFDSSTPGVQNFDPSIHSMQDVQNAINYTYAGQLNANIIDNKLVIDSDPNANPKIDFAFGDDTTGVLAGLGINTFFKGNSAEGLSVNTEIHSDPLRIAAGAVNGQNEINAGDNAIADAISGLVDKNISISTPWRTTNNQTISEYYNTLVAKVGSDTRGASVNSDYSNALTLDLETQQAAVSGVNVDEEMANLIKFQHAYTASAKLITTADEMLQTLLGLKQ